MGIEELIRSWARSVHEGDLDTVLARHASGAVFDIVEVDVIKGDEVAYAWALLRCGNEQGFAEMPERLLRLTLGLRKEDGEWAVAHEHHSFCDTN